MCGPNYSLDNNDILAVLRFLREGQGSFLHAVVTPFICRRHADDIFQLECFGQKRPVGVSKQWTPMLVWDADGNPIGLRALESGWEHSERLAKLRENVNTFLAHVPRKSTRAL